MTLWVVRSGVGGEFENRFLDEGLVGVHFSFFESLENFSSREALRDHLSELWPENTMRQLGGTAAALWRFAYEMEEGDLVVVPLQLRPLIAVGEVTGRYSFAGREGDPPMPHARAVNWLNQEVTRAQFGPVLGNLGARTTCYRPRREGIEDLVRGIVLAGGTLPVADEDDVEADLEPDPIQLARDGIVQFISENFAGHDLAHLAGALLKAQGYQVLVSPPGPDKGIDIRATAGPAGLGGPHVCVQVKSGATPAGHPQLQQLLGSMANAGAEYGIFLSWSGFTRAIDPEKVAQFFKVKFWDQFSFVDELLANYPALPADFRAKLPLRQVWMLAHDGNLT